jgi:hypothetical protein
MGILATKIATVMIIKVINAPARVLKPNRTNSPAIISKLPTKGTSALFQRKTDPAIKRVNIVVLEVSVCVSRLSRGSHYVYLLVTYITIYFIEEKQI